MRKVLLLGGDADANLGDTEISAATCAALDGTAALAQRVRAHAPALLH
jgi:hypothetical protein